MSEQVLSAPSVVPPDAAAPAPNSRRDAPPVWAVAVGFGLVAAADWLFWGQLVGWTLGAFAFSVLAATVLVRTDLLRLRGAWMCLLLAVLACLAMIVAPSPLAVALFLTAHLTLTALVRPSLFASAEAWLMRLIEAAVFGMVRVVGDTIYLPSALRAHAATGRPRAMLQGWALPLLAGSAFLTLFAQANPILGDALDKLDLGRFLGGQLPMAERVFFWVGAGAAVWWLMRCGPASGPELAGPPWTSPAGPQSRSQVWLLDALFSAPAIIRSMLLFNVMFALQNGMDAAYLWGHAALPPGFTFASYAHRGAYPLMATVLLAAGFVLIAFRSVAPSENAKGARALMYLWVAQNVVLVASSIWRMVLYVEVYSLTYARVAALVWMALVALGLVLIVVRFAARHNNTWLVKANVVSLGAVLYVTAFADVGGFIADYNVRHAREVGGRGVQLDFAYIEAIGPRALPALVTFSRLTHAEPSEPGVPPLLRRTNLMTSGAIQRLEAQLYRRYRDWRAWTFSLHRIREEVRRRQALP